MPFVAFSVYAGLTQVSDEVLEAAQLDGATPWQRLWLHHRADDPPGHRDRAAAAADLGPAGVHPDHDAAGCRLPRRATSTCSAPTSTSSAPARRTSAWPAAVSIFVLVLTVALSWFYVRSLLKEDDVMTTATTPAPDPGALGREAPVRTQPRRCAPARRRSEPRIVLGASRSSSPSIWVFPVYWMVNSSLLPNARAAVVHPDLLPVRRLARQLRRACSRTAPSSPRSA